MHLTFLKGCWVLPLKKVAVLKISNCWWGFLGTFVTSKLLLHLPDDLSRHGGMEIDCVVPQALSCLVTLSTATFERFAYTDLCSVAVLGVVLDTVHILWGRRENVSAQVGWHGLCFQLKPENGSMLWAKSDNCQEPGAPTGYYTWAALPRCQAGQGQEFVWLSKLTYLANPDVYLPIYITSQRIPCNGLTHGCSLRPDIFFI